MKLLNAVATGGLLAGSGCGGDTDASDESRGSVEQGEEPEAAVADDDTSGGADDTDEPPVSEMPTPSGDDDAAEEPEAVAPEPESVAQEPEGSGPVTMSPSIEPPDMPVPEPMSSAEPEPAPMCEFGMPGEFCLSRESMQNQATNGFGQIPMDPPRSAEEVAAAYDENGCMRHDWVGNGCCNPGIAPGTPQENGDCCYVACEGARCGRPFVVSGVALTAMPASRRDWVTTVAGELALSTEARQHLARAWVEDALMEHASVASFARFTLDLMAVGAPPELLRDSQRAALDEIDHARLCFGVAERLSNTSTGPGPLGVNGFAPRSLFDALRAAVHEGCVGETLAAGIVLEQARKSTDAAITRVLERIAEDELRHAQLAFRFVAWAIGAHGARAAEVVRHTFEEALLRVPEPPVSPQLPREVLHAGGRLTPAEWSREAERLFDEVVRPAALACVGPSSRAA